MTLPQEYVNRWLAYTEAQKNKEIIESIRDLHQQFYDWCTVCRDPQNPEYNATFPCDTRKLTDGLSSKNPDAPELLTFDFGDW